MKQKVVNLAAFKVAWTVVVVSAAAGAPFAGVIAVTAAIAIHLRSCEQPEPEMRLLLVAAGLGFAWESILVVSGLLSYSSGNLLPGIAPYWIVAMWVLFATTLNSGMRWLRRNKLVAAAAGAIGGPMGFFAGASVGAVELASPVVSLIFIGIGWAVMLPLLVHIAVRLEGGAQRTEQTV